MKQAGIFFFLLQELQRGIIFYLILKNKVVFLFNMAIKWSILMHLTLSGGAWETKHLQSKLPKRSPPLNSHLSYGVILFPPNEKSYMIAQ